MTGGWTDERETINTAAPTAELLPLDRSNLQMMLKILFKLLVTLKEVACKNNNSWNADNESISVEYIQKKILSVEYQTYEEIRKDVGLFCNNIREYKNSIDHGFKITDKVQV